LQGVIGLNQDKNNIINFKDARLKQVKNLKTGFTCHLFAVAVLVSSIYTFGFQGKQSDIPKNSFTYVSLEDDNVIAMGKVRHQEVFNYWYLFEEESICGSQLLVVRWWNHSFYDVRNGNPVNLDSCLFIEKLEPYLLTYNMIQDSYEIGDIEQLLEQIKQDPNYKQIGKRL